MNEIKFTAGDSVSMLVERIEQIGIVEEVYGDSLFIKWVISGSKKNTLMGLDIKSLGIKEKSFNCPDR